MHNLRALLREADPLQYEAAIDRRAPLRRAVLAAAPGAPAALGARTRRGIFPLLAMLAFAAILLWPHIWSLFVGDLQAAVRFEVRLAEDKPAPGLREAKVSGSTRSIYLNNEAIVTNSDIASARLVQNSGSSEYTVSVQFNAYGARKMLDATGNHLGKPLAILLDGQVVVAPVLRSRISGSALITGRFTKRRAEQIVNGVQIR